MRYARALKSFWIILLIMFLGGNSLSSVAEEKVFIKVPKIHTVREGDNLWDLSGKNYQDNFKWRKIWGSNTYVVDPNLIFPGDKIILPGRFVDKEVVKVSLEEKKTIEKKVSKIKPVPFTPPDPRPRKIISDSLFFQAGYISTSENWAGRVISGPEARSIYGETDHLFLKMESGTVAAGDQYAIVERLKKVVHPVSKEVVGALVQEVGLLEITDVRAGSATGLVRRSFSAIEKGDLLIRHEKSLNPLRDLLKKRSATGLEGYVLTGREQRGVFGKGSILYVDRGREDGVIQGDRFIAYRDGEVIAENKKGEGAIVLPDSVYGKIEVFNVRAKTSTAIVIDFIKEFYPGTSLRNVAY